MTKEIDFVPDEDYHAKYSPSQLPRIIGCPGSVSVHEPTPSSEYAIEGTKCHDIVATHLENENYTLDKEALTVFPEDDRAELGQAIQDCLDFAFSIIQKYKGCFVLVETRVSLLGFTSELNCDYLIDVSGTGDLIIMVPNLGVILVIDWKFGKGIEVFPDSEQLKAYGLAALKNPFLASKYNKVYLIVGQPRLYSGEKFKTLETTPDELLSWARDELVPALMEANDINPGFHPSKKACMWCSRKATCGARHELAQTTAMDVFKIYANIPSVTEIPDLMDFLDRARNLVDYVKAIEAHLAKTLMSGKEVPGLKMVEGRSNRKWKSKKAFVEWAIKNHPDAEIFPEASDPISISKAEKLFGRKIAQSDEFKELWEKPIGKHTMVKETDPRPAIKYKTAEEVFAKFVEDKTKK